MAEEMTQVQADQLLAMPKRRVLDVKHQILFGGSGTMIGLCSADRRETFDLGIWRSRAILFKGSYRMKGRGVVMLARVDFGGAPHRNPDGKEIPVPHLHVYREGYADKYAAILPTDRFKDPSDIWAMLDDFMDFCNIIEKPVVERQLF